MAETLPDFPTLPEEYREVLELAQEKYGIAITPLQALSGGWSGARLYLVRVASVDSDELQHLILKLDRINPKASSDEISRHRAVLENSPADFVRTRLPQLAYDRIESADTLAIFYTIAGQSLRSFRTLSSYRQQRRLSKLFAEANHVLLEEWNTALSFETVSHPQLLLRDWLDFRLNPGQNIERFLEKECQFPPEGPGFLVRGELLPNPLLYGRMRMPWEPARPMDVARGMLHRDLNTNNILAKFTPQSGELSGLFLIDFALYKANLPLLFDQRYLEMSYLIHQLAAGPLDPVIDFILAYGEEAIAPESIPIEMAGVEAAVAAGRGAFAEWVEREHPSLHDDLWGQYWLAGAAAGLAYCHKDGLPDRARLAALIFGAANLKRFLLLFDLPMPSEAGQLNIDEAAPGSAAVLLESPSAQRSNLPAPATNFIGREKEMEEVTELLHRPEVRLISLTGPGGTGKTRLALAIARKSEDLFPHGVHFIDLSGLRHHSLVIPTAAHAMGIREGGGQPPLEKLKDYLADRRALLIFDNFEQVTDAASSIAELLSAAPDITFLVTSRVPLQLRGEHEYPVSPLDLPPEIAAEAAEAVGYGSIALFRQQARAVQPSFEVTEENAAAVIEICRRLDGLPLAIEIAAARIKILSPGQLLKRLDQSLEFLVSPDRDRPDRQQTLRSTIDWSYQLLEPQERELFTRLGVFAGGFTLEAAAAVFTEMDEMEVFDGIERLLNNSLLRQTPSANDQPRFDMLQTLRKFALEKAESAGILGDLRRAHCRHYTELASGDMDSGIYGEDSALWLHIFEQEHDNLRQAMAWALEHPEEGFGFIVAMMTQLSWFWYRYGYLQEGSEWMERVLQATEGMEDTPARAFALGGRGSLALWSGDLKRAARLTKESMELGQRLGLDLVVSINKMTYGTTLINQGKDKEAYPHLVDSVELYDDLGMPWLKGTALVHLANVSLGMGNSEQALDWLDTARPLLNAAGDPWTIAFGLNNYGEVARAQGDYEAAEGYYQQTERLYQQADSKGDQARLHTALGFIALHKGEPEEAEARFRRSLQEFRKLGNQRGIAESLAGLACLATELGRERWAAPLLAAAEALLQQVDGVWWPADRGEIERARQQLQSALAADHAGLQQRGAAMTKQEAIAYAEAGWASVA